MLAETNIIDKYDNNWDTQSTVCQHISQRPNEKDDQQQKSIILYTTNKDYALRALSKTRYRMEVVITIMINT